MPIDYDIAVIGAGPVGLCVANLLGNAGIKTLLVEQQAATFNHPRAQTLDDESLRTLQSIGLGERILAKTRPAQGSNYYDAEGECFLHIGPGAQNYGFPKRSYMLQQELDAELYNQLHNCSSVRSCFSTQLTDFNQHEDHITLQLVADQSEAYSVQVAYLLACDGGRSFVRQSLGIEMLGRTYEQDWLVLDTVDDPDQSAVSRFFCNPTRPTVSIASPNAGRRYEFMLLPGESKEDMLQADNIAALLRPFRPYHDSIIRRKVVYTFHARIAERMREQRVLLLGDAAHLSPPFAGQGLNSGIRDAHNIAWKLALLVRGLAHPDLLDSYENERREPAWAMIQLAVAMGDFVMPRSAQQQTLKDQLMQALDQFPGVKDYLFQMKFKPRPRYSDGVFIDLNEQCYESALVGEMIPQPRVKDHLGNIVKLDDKLGSGFVLIAQDDAGETCLNNLAQCSHSFWQALNVRYLRLCFEQTELRMAAAEHLQVIDKDMARPLRTHRDQIMLLRPDRYVLGVFSVEQSAEFGQRVQALLSNPS